MAEQTNNSMEGNESTSETAPLLIETEEQHTDPVTSTSLSIEQSAPEPGLEGPPPAYSEAPPPYTTTPPTGVLGEPTVVCRVCQQLIFIRGRENQRVVKCASCHEATPIKPPPNGKKYIRCPCNALLTCRSTSTRISCPRPNCKRIINVGGGPPTTAPVPQVQNADTRIRVTCGHCNETFVFRTTANLARCPYCRKVSSVGRKFANTRALIFAIIGFIFLVAGVAVTFGTLEMAKSSGGIYVVWIGAFVAGILNLIRSCYYCSMTVSNVEGQA
eukprot:Seg2179.3 transcript_id=Seg2179.3/GoldUCD/mRNA.D3Y31 product="Type 2 phosphatidylinositol 4 5-bisphosphate 4-phosphatase" protein_id=Seg2179.3/GoldUCD/D3Y31